ncbi:FK506-binding protein [Propionibacterium australiense]|nr:Peptidylprolyl isomerase [Propionibacterium australiense]VEH89866.1 FK506-binding protein [Propionibacterium australiense]
MGASGCGNDEETSDASSSPAASAEPSESTSQAPATIIDSLDKIKVEGEAGQAPTVSAEWPLGVDETMSTVLTQGDGAEVPEGGTVEVKYHGVNGRTGVVFDENYGSGKTTTFSLDQVIAGFSKGLAGKHVGDRVLIGVPGSDGYDSAGGAASAGIEVGDTLFFVVDIVSTVLSEPAGATVTVDDANLPTVTWDDGINKPSVSIRSGVDAPNELKVQTLIKGDGPEIADTSATLTVNYLEVAYSDGHVIESTYNDGDPAPESGALNSLIDGWQQGLVGQTVGSRVLLVVPGSLAYPDGNESPAIDPNATLVFVVDILFQQTA